MTQNLFAFFTTKLKYFPIDQKKFQVSFTKSENSSLSKAKTVIPAFVWYKSQFLQKTTRLHLLTYFVHLVHISELH